jgi:hypothetical protein
VFLTKSGKANPDASDAAARARAAGKAAQVAAQNAASAARAAAASAQVAAQNAAQKSQEAAEIAAQKSAEVAQKSQAAVQNSGVTKQVKQGVFTARKWAAPKLESVADYTAGTVAPTVSSALRSTADYTAGTVAPTVSSALRSTAAQVRPAEPVSPAKRRITSALTWSLLGAALVAAAGAVAAAVRYRQRAATEVDSEMPDGALGDTTADEAGKPAGQTAAVPKPAAPKPAAPKAAEPVVPATKASPTSPANQTDTSTDASVNGHANTSGW